MSGGIVPIIYNRENNLSGGHSFIFYVIIAIIGTVILVLLR